MKHNMHQPLTPNQPNRRAGGRRLGAGAMHLIVAGLFFIAGGVGTAHAADIFSNSGDIVGTANYGFAHFNYTYFPDTGTSTGMILSVDMSAASGVMYSAGEIVIRRDNSGGDVCQAIPTRSTGGVIPSGQFLYDIDLDYLATVPAGTWVDIGNNMEAEGRLGAGVPWPNNDCFFDGIDDLAWVDVFWYTASNAIVPIDSMSRFYLRLYDGSPSPTPPVCTGTCFLSVNPDQGDTVATSSVPVEFDIYVNPDEYDDDMYITASFVNQTYTLLPGTSPFLAAQGSTALQGTITFPISGPGESSYSTTTNFAQTGVYNVVYKIVNPSFAGTVLDFFGLGSLLSNQILAERRFSMTVVEPTGLDVAFETGGEALVNFMLTGTSSVSVLDCNPTSFRLEKCLLSVVVPNASTTAVLWNNWKDALFSRMPFGYLTRFVQILSAATDPVLPPALIYTFGSSSPEVLQGLTYEINVFEHMDKLEDIRADDGSNKNLWEIVDPYFTKFVYFAVFLAVIQDLIGLEMGSRITERQRGVKFSRKENEKLNNPTVYDTDEDFYNAIDNNRLG